MKVFIKAKTFCEGQYQIEYITDYSLDSDGDCDGVGYSNANHAMTFDINKDRKIIAAIQAHLCGYQLQPVLHADEHLVVGVEVAPVRPFKRHPKLASAVP